MKTLLNVFFRLTILCLLAGLNPQLIAQEVSPTPIPTSAAKDSKKISCIRAWNYSYLPEYPGLAVCLGPVGDKAPSFETAIWIKRGMRSPKRTTWREIPPGNYEILVFPDVARGGDLGNKIGPGIPLPPSILGSRLGFTVKAGIYQTLILTSANGKLEAQVTPDNLPPGSPRMLRFYKFNTSAEPTISIITDNGQIQPLATNIEANSTSFPVAGAPSAKSYQLTFLNKESLTASLNVELDFSQAASCSIILAPDPYGRLGMEFSTDAPFEDAEKPQ